MLDYNKITRKGKSSLLPGIVDYNVYISGFVKVYQMQSAYPMERKGKKYGIRSSDT